MANDFPLSGSLKDQDLSQILETLLAKKATGTLTLQSGGQAKSIYLKEGMIVFASSNLEEDRLGEMLLKSGRISTEQYRVSVELLRKTGKKQGSVLVEEGFLNPKELFDGLKFQVKEIITSLFLWKEGTYTFLSGELSKQVIPLHLMASDFPMCGSLKDQDLPQILENLLTRKATGSLTLKNRGQAKSIYLNEGMIVFASSNLEEDRLGEMLLKSGRISTEQYRVSVELLSKTGKKQGSVLVEEGFLNPKELFDGLKFQVKEIITSLFLWEDGTYTFFPGELPKQVIPLQLNVADLITEIIQRIQQGTV